MENLHENESPEMEDKTQEPVITPKENALKKFIGKLLVPIIAGIISVGLWNVYDLYFANPEVDIQVKAYVFDKAGYPLEGALVSIVDRPEIDTTNAEGIANFSFNVRMNDREIKLNYEKDKYISEEQTQPILPADKKTYDTTIHLNRLGYFKVKFPDEIEDVLTLK